MGLLDPVSDILFGDDPYSDDIRRQIEMGKQYFGDIEVPDIVWENYRPEEIAFETVDEDPIARSAQMAAMKKMAGLAESGLTAEDEADYAKIRNRTGKQARQARDSILQNAQMRGVAGGGMEFALKDAANQDAVERAQEAYLNKMQTRANQRAMYNRDHLNALGGMRDQDFRANSKNADIINKFNTANTTNRNEAQLVNQQGRRDTQQTNFDNQMRHAGGMAGQNQGMVDYWAARSAADQDKKNRLIDVGSRVGAAVV